jgi:ubiquinone/menaquinone biosynthesis C-methylase UbiE
MSEKGWGSKEFAEAWKRRADERRATMAMVTERMYREAWLRPGMRILDLGTGTGDTAIEVAQRVAAQKEGDRVGSVLATDASESMVELAKEAVKASGVKNVEVRRMDAGAIDVEPSSFDAVIGRQVLMFVDPKRALQGIYRALRPGGYLAATVWGAMLDNPYHAATIGVARRRATRGMAGVPPEIGGFIQGALRTGPPTEIERAFSGGDPAAWSKAIEDAGFRNAKAVPVVGARRFGSGEAALAAMKDSPIHREPIDRLSPDQQEAAWEELAGICDVTGGVFPTMHLVLSGWKMGRLPD